MNMKHEHSHDETKKNTLILATSNILTVVYFLNKR